MAGQGTTVQAIGKTAGEKAFGDLAEAFSSTLFSYFSATCTQTDVSLDTRRPLPRQEHAPKELVL